MENSIRMIRIESTKANILIKHRRNLLPICFWCLSRHQIFSQLATYSKKFFISLLVLGFVFRNVSATWNLMICLQKTSNLPMLKKTLIRLFIIFCVIFFERLVVIRTQFVKFFRAFGKQTCFYIFFHLRKFENRRAYFRNQLSFF